MELKTYYFDTYAFFEMISGNPAYRRFERDIALLTSRFNLMELYYGLVLKHGQSAAERYYGGFLKFCVEPDDETIKEAMIFRTRNKDLRLSYADCIGYTLALKRRVKFLTGDNGFKDLPNVEFVK
ncbi:PIN domain nuclease [Candidatus Woesearchaeota archaeon CG10_big_fil_rev_8_21_14_0_10_44_13]|nr:MAG: PIN domain nuclease [Candidatus Woesearchaeota archaeon CG10_big_fil_rev_8_21_14_0_10_44_13]